LSFNWQYEKISSLGYLHKLDKLICPPPFTLDNYTREYECLPWWEAFLLVFLQFGGKGMNTAILSFVLAGALLAGQNTATWQNDYSQARQQAAAQRKPLAVVFGSGSNGWTKVVRENRPSPDVTKVLTEQYICVYVDTTSPAGRKLGESFGITRVGIALSDRDVKSQAFWHQGDMTNGGILAYLRKYADPAVIVSATETVDEPENPARRKPSVEKVAQPATPVRTAEPVWQSSYAVGRQRAAEQKRPLAIFFSSGANGWRKVVGETPTAEASRLLAEGFVCVYVDTASPAGKHLAQSFEMTGLGLVISDRSAASQAFWHQGTMTNQALISHLQKYGDTDLLVTSTVMVRTVPEAGAIRQTSGETPAPAQPVVVKIEPVKTAVPALTPVWLTSYTDAQKQSTQRKKPLAIVFGPGTNGWTKVVRDGAPTEEVSKLLAEQYACVYVDTASPAGKKLAQDFKIYAEMGLVVGDRAGESQAFWHQGDLTNDYLTYYLKRYADPNYVALATETVTVSRTSFYPAGNYAPVYYRPVSSGSC
jgi:hypothetical protein